MDFAILLTRMMLLYIELLYPNRSLCCNHVHPPMYTPPEPGRWSELSLTCCRVLWCPCTASSSCVVCLGCFFFFARPAAYRLRFSFVCLQSALRTCTPPLLTVCPLYPVVTLTEHSRFCFCLCCCRRQLWGHIERLHRRRRRCGGRGRVERRRGLLGKQGDVAD